MCILIFSTTFETFPILKRPERDKIKNYISLHVEHPLFLSEVKLKFQQICEKYTNIKLHENPSSGRRVPCGRMDRRTDMMKLIVAFRSFANEPKSV